MQLPPFRGPLHAFVSFGVPGDLIYLGGDLHAGHPESGEGAPPQRAPLLDAARITLVLDDPAGERIETTATRGVWCLALSDGQSESSALLAVADRDGGLRAWLLLLLLPPARTMPGRAHLWLPALAPPSRG